MRHSITRATTIAAGIAAVAMFAARVSTQAPPDVAPPRVEISSPTTDQTISGVVTVTAAAVDNVGVTGVQFVLNGMPLGNEDTTAPFTVSWDTTTSERGAHILSAIAWDDMGNVGDSELVPIIVGVGSTPPPPPPGGNGAPELLSDEVLAPSGAPVVFTAAFLLANDFDPNGDTLIITSVGATGTAGGTVTDNGGGSWTYSAPAGYEGIDTFAYTVSDGRGGSASAIVSVTVSAPPTGLVAAYSFDEAGGSMATDTSGHGNHGTITGATRVAGRFGRALSFDGINDVVRVPDSSSLALVSGMTIEAWVRPNLLSGWRTVALKETATGLAYALYAHDDAPRPAVTANFGGADQSAAGVQVLPLGTWTHLAATYDGAAMKLYVNGTLVRSQPATGTFVQSARPLSIGGNAVWGEYFAGSIDQLRLYDRPLTAAEIDANSRIAVTPAPPAANTPPVANGDSMTTTMNTTLAVSSAALLANDNDPDGDALSVSSVASSSAAGGTITPAGEGSWTYAPPSAFTGNDSFGYTIEDGRGGSASGTVAVSVTAPVSGLVGAWSFNDGAGTTAADASGNGRVGTIRQAAWTASGRYGAALSFDGINDWVTVADHASLDLTTGMTLEVWVKPGAMSGWETILLKERGANDYSYGLYAHDGAPLDGGSPVPSGNVKAGGAFRTLRGTTALPAGTWSHVATTYDGTTQRLFVNGVEVASRPQTGPIAVGAGALRMGGNNSWTGEFFQGEIDEVRIYNRALSPTEIAADMNTPIP